MTHVDTIAQLLAGDFGDYVRRTQDQAAANYGGVILGAVVLVCLTAIVVTVLSKR